MPVRLTIESEKIGSLDDVYDLVMQLPSMPGWFGRNLDAMGELAYFVPEPLEIVVFHPKALEQRLGPKDFRALMSTLEAIRDSNVDDPAAKPASLTIHP